MKIDIILYNGLIHTLADRDPQATAVAISEGKISALGKTNEIEGLRNRDTEMIDLKGRVVVPGFTDSHIHFTAYAMSLRQIMLSGISSLEEVINRVRSSVKSRAKGEWILGGGWDHHTWEGGELPHKRDLDRVADDNPVALTRKDGHQLWVNSLALHRAGITSSTPDPEGGEIGRDAKGELTGLLRERAMSAIYNIIPVADRETLSESVGEAISKVQALGITSIHNCEGREAFQVFQDLLREGELGLRVYMMIPKDNLEEAIKLGIRTGFGNDKLRIGGVKLFADGSLGSKTASMLEAYEDDPHNLGVVVTPHEELLDLVNKASRSGISVAIHAIGDRANRDALDVIEDSIRGGYEFDLRQRIEHAQLLTPEDLPRFSQLGVIASMQPIHATSDMFIADKFWGERSRWAYAFRSLLARGTRLTFGSDCPVESPDPLKGMYAAVTRRRENGEPADGWFPEERITAFEALHSYTKGAAYASYEENIKGTIEVGKLADLVVLSKDILNISPEDIRTTEVDYTIFDGSIVYRRE